MRKLLNPLLIAIFSFQLAACAPPQDVPADDTTVEESGDSTEDSGGTEDQTAIKKPGPGEIPFDYPSDVDSAANAGDFVLAPSRSALDDAFESGGEDATMIFYSRVMAGPADAESSIEEFSEEVKIPNSLIVPIRSGESAEPGDIVLTWWQSGSGMTRAIIVDGGSEREPMARYLDLSFEYEPERLKLDSFHLLTKELEPGTSIAVKEGGEYIHEIVINVAGDKVLTSGFASIMNVRNKSDIIAVPIAPEIEIGQEVYVPVISTFQRGIVKAIDESSGKVTVEYEWAGSTSEEDFPYGDVIEQL